MRPAAPSPDYAVDPDDDVRHHLVAVGLVQHFVPPARIEFMTDAGEAVRCIGIKQTANAARRLADRILAAAENMDREIRLHRAERGRCDNTEQRDNHPVPCGERTVEPAKRIGDIFIDLSFIAGEPVKIRPVWRERPVEAFENAAKLRVMRTGAKFLHSAPHEGEPHPRLQLLQPRLRPVAARQYNALYAVAVAGDIVLRHEGTHGVAEEKDRHARMPRRDLPVEAIKIADGRAPARLIAKMPGRRAIRYIQPVPAMICGIDNIAKG